MYYKEIIMNIKMLKAAVAGLVLSVSGFANAGLIEFIPPNDETGQVFSTNGNDIWSAGRGLVFEMLSNETIDSLGVYHDLSNINLFYELSQVTSLTGAVTSGQTILRSGNALTTTNGLNWIDFGIADLMLSAGNYYHLEFTFSGNGNQNFFYNNGNAAFSEGSFINIEGTQAGNTSNFVMPALRVNTTTQVPEPSTLAIFALGIMGLASRRFKKQ
jgi:hypothetical protein